MSWALALLAVALSLLAYAVVLSLTRKVTNAKRLPYSLPLIGDLPRLLVTRKDALKVDMWARVFAMMGPGQSFRFHALPHLLPSVWVSAPENLKHITTDNFDNYKRLVHVSRERLVHRMAKLLFGQGIFLTDDDVWAYQRKIAATMFHKKSLDEMVPHFVAVGQEVLCILEANVDSASIDIQKLFMRYTLDTFGKIAFGRSFKSLSTPDAEFPKQFDFVQRLINEFAVDLSWQVRSKEPYYNAIAALDDFIFKTIANLKRDSANETPEQRAARLNQNHDLLSKFMRLTDSDGKPYPDQWLRDIVLNFVIAGRDTTGLLLSWFFYEMSQNPEVLKRLEREMEEVFQGELPNEVTLEKTPYLDNVLKEVLRLRPSIPRLIRFAKNDDTLPDGTFVPSGTMVLLFPYSTHRLPQYWDEPMRFNPDRWNNPNVLKHKFQYMPFYAGGQRCLGEFMAQKEAKAMIALILQRFRLEHDPTNKVEGYFGIAMPAINGIKMTVHRR